MTYEQKQIVAHVRTFVNARRTARKLTAMGATSYVREALKLATYSMKKARMFKAKG